MHPDETSRHSYPTGQYGTPVRYPEQFGPQEHSTAQFGPPPMPPSRKRFRKAEVIAAAVIVLVALGVGVAFAVAKRDAAPAAGPTAAARQPANVACEHGQLPNGACAGVADPAITYATPTAADFKLSLKITDKQCFGSAGCNVGFEIVLDYTGRAVAPSSSWDVTYDITGAEDPYTSTMTVEFDGAGMPASYEQRDSQMIQTKKSSAKLAITVTAVSAGH